MEVGGGGGGQLEPEPPGQEKTLETTGLAGTPQLILSRRRFRQNKRHNSLREMLRFCFFFTEFYWVEPL